MFSNLHIFSSPYASASHASGILCCSTPHACISHIAESCGIFAHMKRSWLSQCLRRQPLHAPSPASSSPLLQLHCAHSAPTLASLLRGMAAPPPAFHPAHNVSLSHQIVQDRQLRAQSEPLDPRTQNQRLMTMLTVAPNVIHHSHHLSVAHSRVPQAPRCMLPWIQCGMAAPPSALHPAQNVPLSRQI